MAANSRDHQGALYMIAASAFLLQLALAPISAALPSIVADFGGNLEVGGWVLSSFLIVLTGLVLVAGRLGDHYGHQRVFKIGVALFGIASLAAALSVDLGQMIVARALQGAGGALLSGNGLAVLANAFAPERRGRAIGFVGVTSSLGGVVGILFSTMFITVLSWRWLFVLAAVLSIVTLWLAFRVMDLTIKRGKSRIDIGGALLLFALLTFLSLSMTHLHEGEETFAAGAGYHFTMHALFLASLVGLLWWESRAEDPILPFGRFRNGLFTSAVAANGILHMTMMAAVFLLPFVIVRGLGLTAVYVGIMLGVMQGCTTASAYAGGWLYDRTRSRLITPAAMTVVGLGLTSLGLFADQMSFWGIFAIVVFIGCFTGAFMTVNSTIVMGALGTGERGFASGMSETTRQLGHTLAITAVTVVVAFAGGSLGADATPSMYVAGFRSATIAMGAVAFLGVLLSLRATESTGGPRLQPTTDVPAIGTRIS